MMTILMKMKMGVYILDNPLSTGNIKKTYQDYFASAPIYMLISQHRKMHAVDIDYHGDGCVNISPLGN